MKIDFNPREGTTKLDNPFGTNEVIVQLFDHGDQVFADIHVAEEYPYAITIKIDSDYEGDRVTVVVADAR